MPDVVSKNNQSQAIVRIYGVTKEGNSVCCHVYGFLPYFYAPVPDTFDKIHLDEFQNELNRKVLEEIRGNKDIRLQKNVSLYLKQQFLKSRLFRNAVINIEIKKCQDISGFNFNAMNNFFKITVALPRFIPSGLFSLEIDATSTIHLMVDDDWMAVQSPSKFLPTVKLILT